MRHIDGPIVELGIGEMMFDGAVFLYTPEDCAYRESIYYFVPEKTEIVMENYRWEPWYKNMRPRLR